MESGHQLQTPELPDAATFARAFGITREAAEIYLHSHVIDLHVDSFIWTRVFGYDLSREHGPGLLGARYFSQVDFPRLTRARVTGALWSITTNPCRSATGRQKTFTRNLDQLQADLCAGGGSGCRGAQRKRVSRRACEWPARRVHHVQGGNALDRAPQALDALEGGPVLAVTVMHLSNSRLGTTSATPRSRDRGLTNAGRAYVEGLNALRIFVDLAHVGRRGFFDALAVHDRTQPLLVTHTGVSGVYPSWRNIDDEQLRAVAETGGLVGVIFHGGYLAVHTGAEVAPT